jgi:glucose-1-phosphate cytidylyltransferase
MIERFDASGAVAGLLAVPPQSSHHVVDIGDDGLITQVTPMRDLRQWENGGYFLFRPEIFDELIEGEDLVEGALMRLIFRSRVVAYPYKGYWSPADTVKERAQLEEMYQRGDCPWMIWDKERSGREVAGARARVPTLSSGTPS